MSRKHKTGLDYFSFDVDFFNDEKIEFVSAKYGSIGELIVVKLLCRIYRNGYFLKWGRDESLLFAKRAGDGISQDKVDEVINELLERDFLCKKIYKKYSILTSNGIQRRFLEATKRRKSVDVAKEYLIVDISGYDVNIISLNVDINPQRKVKESKGKNIHEEFFEKFWKIIPARRGKKIDKPKAIEKFNTLKESDLPTIIECAKNYANSEGVKEGIGIKDPHRFISNRDNPEYWKEWLEPEISQKKDYEVIIDGVSTPMTETEYKQWEATNGR